MRKLLGYVVAMMVVAAMWMFLSTVSAPVQQKIDANAEYRARVERMVYVREATHAALREREYLVCVANNIKYETRNVCR
jgi:hypothetical protein